MDANTMKETLIQKATEIREDLVKLEAEFNQKKEQYLKIQGALEALNELDSPSTPTE